MQRLNLAHLHELCDLFIRLKKRTDALGFLKDILTPRELASVVERWQIIKRLARYKPHREISKELKVSIDKVTRGAKALKHGHGGFRHMLWPKKKV
ncbi:transcriptional regulator [Candidatus Peregrinibacteria bacterium]|nr:transcriptional regulator [Candidatus Peregrinibacteria bacterium]